MPIVLVVFALGTLVLLPSVFLKLAALLSWKKVRWKHCFVFGAAAAILSIAGRAISLSIGHSLPVWLAGIVSCCIYLSAGSWFLSSRGIDKEGRPLGFVGGMKVIIVFLALLALFSVGALAIGNALLGSRSQ